MKKYIPIIQAKNLTVGYDSKSILSGIDFSIYPGDMICLMGHNGCGKTTILRTLSRILKKISGEINIKDREIESWDDKDLSKLISIVLTERIENPNITVRELVELGRYPYTSFIGLLSDDDKSKVDDALKLLGIGELQEKRIGELSDGQRQKAFIARALAQDTEVLLLDEPTTFLDLPGKMEILKILKNIAREKKVAILFSSHDWGLILELASWIWLINREGSLSPGVPEDFILNGDFEDCFNHKDFTFDNHLGFFKEIRETEHEVCLLGGDYKTRHWTDHLLRKESFKVNESLKEGIPVIVIKENHFELDLGAEKKVIKTLENLIVSLKKQILD